jgi:hypothetical protein
VGGIPPWRREGLDRHGRDRPNARHCLQATCCGAPPGFARYRLLDLRDFLRKPVYLIEVYARPGAAELHLHPRGATGKESLAAVDTAILSLRGACPGTLIGVSTGAWIENDAVHTRNCIDQWSELPDYASVNSAIMIATASSEAVSVSMRKLRMRPAACSTCDLRHSARRKNVRRGQG